MIMAGGSGTRLWPMSREKRPKQLLPLISPGDSRFTRSIGAAKTDDRALSLLEVAASRVDGVVPPERRYICTGESFRTQIRACLPQFSDGQILGEPCGRDTVNAVGLTAAVLHKQDKDAIFIVLTADHLISPEDKFRDLVELAFRIVELDKKRLVTFSIKPTYPATGFGYVERGPALLGLTDSKGKPIVGSQNLAFRVARFVEKPDMPRAQAYVESGHFGWNSGMFVFHAGTVLDCLKRFKPECHEGLMRIADAWGTKEQARVLGEVYPTLPKISVDYAIMEPASRDTQVSIGTVLADVDWLDVGSWPSYAETLAADALGNRAGGGVKALFVDSAGSLVTGESAPNAKPHTVAVLGAKDMIIVHTPDATLVMPKAYAEQLKKLHALVDGELK